MANGYKKILILISYIFMFKHKVLKIVCHFSNFRNLTKMHNLRVYFMVLMYFESFLTKNQDTWRYLIKNLYDHLEIILHLQFVKQQFWEAIRDSIYFIPSDPLQLDRGWNWAPKGGYFLPKELLFSAPKNFITCAVGAVNFEKSTYLVRIRPYLWKLKILLHKK